MNLKNWTRGIWDLKTRCIIIDEQMSKEELWFTGLNMGIRISIPKEKVVDFCERWNITELAFFGSVLRDDFGPESDIDVLVNLRLGTSHRISSILHYGERVGRHLGKRSGFGLSIRC